MFLLQNFYSLRYYAFLTLILTPNFSSPVLEENAVGVRIQFPT